MAPSGNGLPGHAAIASRVGRRRMATADGSGPYPPDGAARRPAYARPIPESETTRRAWIVLLLACMAGFAGALDLSVVFVAFPEIEDAFPDSSTALLSWVLTVYGIVIAALLVP